MEQEVKNNHGNPDSEPVKKKRRTNEEIAAELDKKIAAIQEKEDKIKKKKAELKAKKQRLNRAEQMKERKARDHRLIQHGAMLEAALCQLFPERYQKETMAGYNNNPELEKQFEKDLYVLLERSQVVSNMFGTRYNNFDYWNCGPAPIRDALKKCGFPHVPVPGEEQAQNTTEGQN